MAKLHDSKLGQSRNSTSPWVRYYRQTSQRAQERIREGCCPLSERSSVDPPAEGCGQTSVVPNLDKGKCSTSTGQSQMP